MNTNDSISLRALIIGAALFVLGLVIAASTGADTPRLADLPASRGAL